MKFIDAHMHIVEYINGFGSQGELRALGDGLVKYSSGYEFRIIPKGMGEYGVTVETMLDLMDENQIEKAVLLQGNYLGFQNLYTYEAITKYPARFKAAATFDPFCRSKDKIISYLFDELHFKILKLELSNGSGLMCNHDTIDLNGATMHEIYQMAQARKLTLVMDIGRPRNDCWGIDKLAEAISKYPKVTFVICHLLACQIDDESLLVSSLLKLKMPNVYFDLASISSNTKPDIYPYPTALKYIKQACQIIGSEHLMWGSDAPQSICNVTYASLKDYILLSTLFCDKEKEDIFYQTANKIYFTD